MSSLHGSMYGGDEIPPRAFPSATPLDSARFILTTSLPGLAQGVVAVRRRVAGALIAAGVPDRAAKSLRGLRARHGDTVWIRSLSGRVLLVLGGDGLERFFSEPVEVLALDAPEKRLSLGVIEPTGVIVSHGPLQAERNRVNCVALATGRPVHPDAARFLHVTAQENRAMLALAHCDASELTYQHMETCFQRISRRCVLGDRAADDEELHARLMSLRFAGNWLGAVKWRNKRDLREYERISHRLRDYAATAGPDTLLGRIMALPAKPGTDLLGQAHHWLLSIDAIASAAARTLMVLAAHPVDQDTARSEAQAGRTRQFMNTCFQESLRLWPVVPGLLRVTRAEMTWDGVPIPVGTSILAPLAFHQRDAAHVPDSDRFIPGRWLEDSSANDERLSPFSRGEGECPGRELALQIGPAFCAEVLRTDRLAMIRPMLDAGALPRAVDFHSIRLAMRPASIHATSPAARESASARTRGTSSA